MLLKHPRYLAPIRVSLQPGATVKDLIKAFIKELGLGVSILDLQVRLAQGKPLGLLEPLEEQGITAGSVVHIEPVPPPGECCTGITSVHTGHAYPTCHPPHTHPLPFQSFLLCCSSTRTILLPYR